MKFTTKKKQLRQGDAEVLATLFSVVAELAALETTYEREVAKVVQVVRDRYIRRRTQIEAAANQLRRKLGLPIGPDLEYDRKTGAVSWKEPVQKGA